VTCIKETSGIFTVLSQEPFEKKLFAIISNACKFITLKSVSLVYQLDTKSKKAQLEKLQERDSCVDPITNLLQGLEVITLLDFDIQVSNVCLSLS
jgi:hypothetical protein